MPLSITLTKRQDREWFTSLDDVCGRVIFTNRRCVGVGRITVYLECRFRSVLTFSILELIDQIGVLKTSIRLVNAGQHGAFSDNEHLVSIDPKYRWR